jgi:hypothetical protein
VRAARLAVALAVFAAAAGAYIAGASVEPASWDTAELQGVPFILGIAHPTGFPFYVLLGYVWSHLIAFGTVAWRMNVMSALAMSAAAVAAYATAVELGASLPVAFLATLWFAFSQDVWAHAVRAEAQDVAVACAATAIYAFLRWMRGAGPAWFAAAFALCGLGMAAHPNALWILPAFVAGALVARRRPSVRLAVASGALLVAALMLYLYLPLRSAYVVAHHLDPAAVLPGAGGGIFWNYNDPRTPHGLMLELTGSEFETPTYFLASFNPLHVGAALSTFVSTTRAQYGTYALVAIFAGFVLACRRDWRAALVLCTACIAGLVFSVVYPNESDVGRYRLLVSWLAVPFLGALTPRSGGIPARLASLLHGALIVFLAVGAILAFNSQRGFFNRTAGEGGRWVIRAVRPYAPPGSVIVTGWLDATSLAYGAYVDGSLPGRIIVSDDRLDVPLYRTWTHGRRVFVLINPHDTGTLEGATDYATLDSYHELYAVKP